MMRPSQKPLLHWARVYSSKSLLKGWKSRSRGSLLAWKGVMKFKGFITAVRFLSRNWKICSGLKINNSALYPKHSDHIKYARAALSVIRKTPEGKEAINNVITLIQKRLKDPYNHLPRNPYDHLNWTRQETVSFFYCNLAEHKVKPSKFLERITATLVAHSKGFHKFHSYMQLQYSLSRAVLSLAPKPLMWSKQKNEWIVKSRIPVDALESLRWLVSGLRLQ